MNLCCLIHPQYVCFCGFQECWDHWKIRRDNYNKKSIDSLHFDNNNMCRATGKYTRCSARIVGDTYYWDEAVDEKR